MAIGGEGRGGSSDWDLVLARRQAGPETTPGSGRRTPATGFTGIQSRGNTRAVQAREDVSLAPQPQADSRLRSFGGRPPFGRRSLRASLKALQSDSEKSR